MLEIFLKGCFMSFFIDIITCTIAVESLLSEERFIVCGFCESAGFNGS